MLDIFFARVRKRIPHLEKKKQTPVIKNHPLKKNLERKNPSNIKADPCLKTPKIQGHPH